MNNIFFIYFILKWPKVSVSQFPMIQECKGIFCIGFFFFHKAFYLWLYMLAISAVPPSFSSVHSPPVTKGVEISTVCKWLSRLEATGKDLSLFPSALTEQCTAAS